MVVLGLNGLLHDAAACVLQNGYIVSAMEHERVCRFKNGYLLFPFETIEALLKEQGLQPDDVDCVSWNFDYRRYHLSGLCGYLRSVRGLRDISTLPAQYGVGLAYKLYQYFFVKSVLNYLFMAATRKPRIVFTPHHLGHFLYSYYASPFQDCAGLIVDGGGEYASTTLLDYRGGRLRHLHSQGMPADSLGIVYSIGTHYLGFKPSGDEYKVMGLASFGSPNARMKDFFERLIRLEPGGRYAVDKRLISFPRDMLFTFTPEALALLGHPPGGGVRLTKSPVTQFHKDFAWALQHRLEESVMHIARYLRHSTMQDDVVLGGGVFLNASLNGVLRRSGIFREIFVPPAPHDAGTAIGAALYGCRAMGNSLRRDAVTGSPHPYLGTSWDDVRIEEALVRAKLSYEHLRDRRALIDRTVSAICDGKIVGWFQGRMEFGPRALGNRSILADPRPKEMQTKMNAAIKNRESFRPFAPSVLEEHMSMVFEHEKRAPHMITIDRIRADMRLRVPAVTHVDGTGRPQSVRRSDNPLYYDLISAFHTRTGIPLLLNTSFNYNDEPIVRAPEDAIRCFHSTGLDVLVLGNFWLEKRVLAASGYAPVRASL
jgi:carbamoyltransferase